MFLFLYNFIYSKTNKLDQLKSLFFIIPLKLIFGLCFPFFAFIFINKYINLSESKSIFISLFLEVLFFRILYYFFVAKEKKLITFNNEQLTSKSIISEEDSIKIGKNLILFFIINIVINLIIISMISYYLNVKMYNAQYNVLITLICNILLVIEFIEFFSSKILFRSFFKYIKNMK